jgi:hypothetical protein
MIVVRPCKSKGQPIVENGEAFIVPWPIQAYGQESPLMVVGREVVFEIRSSPIVKRGRNRPRNQNHFREFFLGLLYGIEIFSSPAFVDRVEFNALLEDISKRPDAILHDHPVMIIENHDLEAPLSGQFDNRLRIQLSVAKRRPDVDETCNLDVVRSNGGICGKSKDRTKKSSKKEKPGQNIQQNKLKIILTLLYL